MRFPNLPPDNAIAGNNDPLFPTLRAEEPFAYGLMVLAGTLRQHGHDVGLVQGNDIQTVMTDPATAGADVLALSATTGLHRIYPASAMSFSMLGIPGATFGEETSIALGIPTSPPRRWRIPARAPGIA